MFSRFVRLFKSTDKDELRALQTRVASILKEKYPEKQIVISPDPQVINFEGRPCGLTNIRSAFLLSSQSDDDFRAIVSDHFRILVANKELLDRDKMGWELAQERLMPQLMPKEFLDKVPLVHQPFGDNIVLAFVIDTDEAYSYVSSEDLERWEIAGADLMEIALTN